MRLPDVAWHLRQLLAQVPEGRVTTYGTLAAAMGDPVAARWIGYFVLRHDHHRRDQEIPVGRSGSCAPNHHPEGLYTHRMWVVTQRATRLAVVEKPSGESSQGPAYLSSDSQRPAGTPSSCFVGMKELATLCEQRNRLDRTGACFRQEGVVC